MDAIHIALNTARRRAIGGSVKDYIRTPRSEDPDYKDWLRQQRREQILDPQHRYLTPDDFKSIEPVSPEPLTSQTGGAIVANDLDLPPEAMAQARRTGDQLGSNPGGTFTDFPDGIDRYVKVPANERRAREEVLAGKLYQAVGVPVAQTELTRLGGRIAVASQIVPNSKPIKDQPPDSIDQLREHFPADAWLANWDVVGGRKDNIRVDADNNAWRIDQGGALSFKPKGTPKGYEFGVKVNETKTIPSPRYASGEVFGGIKPDPNNATAQRIAALPDHTIRDLVHHYIGEHDAYGMRGLADKLIARRDDLAKQYGQPSGYQEGGPVELPEIEVKPNQPPPQVSEEDIERARMDERAQAEQQPGVLSQLARRFIPDVSGFIGQTPEQRQKFWNELSERYGPNLPGRIWEGVKGMVSGPGEAVQHGTTSEEAVPWAASTTMQLASQAPLAGKGQIGVFGGEGSLLHNSEALATAKKMDAEGALNPNQIYFRTGWFKDPGTGKWMYHHDMSNAFLHPQVPRAEPGSIEESLYGKGAVIMPTGIGAPLHEVMQHPDLYDAYPSLKDWTVAGTDRRDIWGSVNYQQKLIRVSPQSEEQLMNTLTHEANHVIQSEENLSRGSSVMKFLPPEYVKIEKDLQSRRESLKQWFTSKGVDPNQTYKNINNAIRNPDSVSPEMHAEIKGALGAGRYSDIIDMLNKQDLQNKIREEAQSRYLRTFGEAMSRQSELRRTMTPEENRQLTIPKAMGMIENPIPWRDVTYGETSPISYSELESAKLPVEKPQRDRLGFYSKADKILSSAPNETATARDWAGYLKNKGLKPEEAQYLGLTNLLDRYHDAFKDQPIHRGHLQNYIRNNRVKLRQTIADIDPSPSRLPEEWGGNPQTFEETQGGIDIPDATMPGEEYFAAHPQVHPADVAHHGDRVLPGGRGYHELKLQLEKDVGWEQEHYPHDPDLIAAARLDTRNIDKLKSLFVNEAQSDWHQQGSQRGYLSPERTQRIMETQPNDGRRFDLPHHGGDEIPDAPFKKAWPEMLFKKLIMHAIETGHKQIAWPADIEGIKTIQGWPGLRKEGDRWFTAEAGDLDILRTDVTPIIRRYLQDLPDIANKIGRPHGSSVLQRQHGNYKVNVFRINPKLAGQAYYEGFSDWKRGGGVGVSYAR
jgi:hypothetical protein